MTKKTKNRDPKGKTFKDFKKKRTKKTKKSQACADYDSEEDLDATIASLEEKLGFKSNSNSSGDLDEADLADDFGLSYILYGLDAGSSAGDAFRSSYSFTEEDGLEEELEWEKKYNEYKKTERHKRNRERLSSLTNVKSIDDINEILNPTKRFKNNSSSIETLDSSIYGDQSLTTRSQKQMISSNLDIDIPSSLSKSIKSLFNSLTISNFASILQEMSSILSQSPHNSVSTVLAQTLATLCISGSGSTTQAIKSLILTSVALISHLSFSCDMMIGATTVETIAKELDYMLEHLESLSSPTRFSIHNLLFALCSFYNYSLISPKVLYTLISTWISSNVAVVIPNKYFYFLTLLFTFSGPNLKKDYPSILTTIIELAQQKNLILEKQQTASQSLQSTVDFTHPQKPVNQTAHIPPVDPFELSSERISHLISLLTSLKHNKHKNTDTMEYQMQQQLIMSVKQIPKFSPHPIGISWAKLLAPVKIAKWWLHDGVGSSSLNTSTNTDRNNTTTRETEGSSLSKKIVIRDYGINNLENFNELVSLYSINTPARRSSFKVLLSSVDENDALRGLMKLGYNAEQQQDWFALFFHLVTAGSGNVNLVYNEIYGKTCLSLLTIEDKKMQKYLFPGFIKALKHKISKIAVSTLPKKKIKNLGKFIKHVYRGLNGLELTGKQSKEFKHFVSILHSELENKASENKRLEYLWKTIDL